ncbi:hypothetical protein TIFTF001_013884 [Ficus carica]|uniref:Uncharacterized protein n=1 Tax=Ficus carica TaxID=3494 RepID=A0AA88A2R0_FICCA|nr:hypothetical protein TIFTF001_013884 [Ficus carica]
MGSKLSPSNPLNILSKLSTKRQKLCPKTITFSFTASNSTQTQQLKSELYTVNFRTLRACKLGISRYPDFEYNAEGGKGTGSGSKVPETNFNDGDEILVSFDVNTLYIPPLTSSTTKFLGLPLPPFLKISIDPEIFRGSIDQNTGKVNLEFKAKFWFTIGSIYKAPPLMVETVLTSEESAGKIRSGRGDRLDKEGKCRLVGVATVEPIDDFLLNSFLGLPTECLADLNAVISFSDSS